MAKSSSKSKDTLSTVQKCRLRKEYIIQFILFTVSPALLYNFDASNISVHQYIRDGSSKIYRVPEPGPSTGGEDFFQKILGGEEIFFKNIRGEDVFSRKNSGGEDFFQTNFSQNPA